MIFGFNTDVKAGETVYHVQTEVREQERRLESSVFVSGRCVGTRVMELAASSPENSQVQELARAQHRWLLEAIREGFLPDVITRPAEICLQFLGSERIGNEKVQLRFQVSTGGFAAPAAQVTGVWKSGTCEGSEQSTESDSTGIATMCFGLGCGMAELVVSARFQGREAVRKFRIKSARL